jgi:hypothetical protein
MKTAEAVKKLKCEEKAQTLVEVLEYYRDRYTLTDSGIKDWNGRVISIEDMENINTKY